VSQTPQAELLENHDEEGGNLNVILTDRHPVEQTAA
jgi:hypothetical protein